MFTRAIVDVPGKRHRSRDNDGTAVGYSGRAALKKEQCDRTTESRSSGAREDSGPETKYDYAGEASSKLPDNTRPAVITIKPHFCYNHLNYFPKLYNSTSIQKIEITRSLPQAIASNHEHTVLIRRMSGRSLGTFSTHLPCKVKVKFSI
jgi:hypothetical protein